MPDNVKVIIARYQEDVSWADALGYDYVVYDKGGNQDITACFLPNIGREAHTYFTHMVREYDRLNPMNVFLQGDPFDHIDDQGRASVETLRLQLEDVADRMVPFKGLAWFKLKCDALGRPHDLHKPENQGRWAGWGRDIPVGEIFTRLFNTPMPAQIISRAPTGNFCVTGERIRTRPKRFYEFCLKLIEADPQDERNTGHAFERLWQHVFNGNTDWNQDSYE
ncbi:MULTISPECIES: DUF3431 domain-containing protein [unclassified Pseudodesulfovibrio]|uniref:DUF3431 domain-containing protein n=1 Tax=unclassified Pseudodesulfovibrio TaxID=2661612 RepID=UPI000FEB73E6|nr:MULTISPECIES: DUF3431 domain-containing protein [unclassified Pseudodesulfovibrio]MCJ2165178.1 DUF3431 domain-containing protein [Pseudodesulfovibrio sp. S3-i]RWU03372.1 DUF3431 domain-containing protein [Pseudodesulfovibrio sp. S3]